MSITSTLIRKALKENRPNPILPCGKETSIKSCITIEDLKKGKSNMLKMGMLWYNTTGNGGSTNCAMITF